MADDLSGSSLDATRVTHGGAVSYLGVVPSWALKVLDWPILLCEVGLHPDTIEHIGEKRGEDAPLLLAYLHRAVQGPHLCGPDPEDGRRLLLVHLLEEHRGMAVALKLVRASCSLSGADELWVSTTYLMGRRSLTRFRRRRTFTMEDGTSR